MNFASATLVISKNEEKKLEYYVACFDDFMAFQQADQ